MGTRDGIVGRTVEQARLAESIEQSARGTPSAVLVSGEAGVGKTSLVTKVTQEYTARGHLVLWGRCLRFGADSSPYLPIGQILTHWHRQAGSTERTRVLTGAEDLATIAPTLAAVASRTEAGHLISLASSAIDRISDGAPTVVVIDDLQWADTTSLDMLAYVLAGLTTGKRLTVLATYRDTDLGAGHRLHGWLADVSRLPSVSKLKLGRLGLVETEELVANLRGPQGSTRLGADLFARSGGNPYLIELLARAPAPPEDVPVAADGSLQSELLASWHRLTAPSRRLLQLLAVGGRPVALEILSTLAGDSALPSDTAHACVGEATDEGVTTVATTGEVWFRHPLLAEVIATTLTPADQIRIHAEYVDVWEQATEAPAASRAAHLALHHAGAANPDEAFTWSLRAAASSSEVLAFAEEFAHLHRACRLWPDVEPRLRGTNADRAGLLVRTSDSAMRAGEYMLALELREEALPLIDPDERPLEAARLLFLVPLLKDYSVGQTGFDLADSAAVLSLTGRVPASPEHAMALAQHAFVELWRGEPDASKHAERAVLLAQKTGSKEALAWAIGVRSQTKWEEDAGLHDAEASVELARTSGNPQLLSHAGIWRSNCLESLGRFADAASTTNDVFRELVSRGSFYEAAQLATTAGQFLVELGRWPEARRLLREVLSRRLQSRWGGVARAIAADLAWRAGDLDAARQHLERARELEPQLRLVGSFVLNAMVHVAWAEGDPGLALTLIEEALPIAVPVDPDVADELLLWAARVCCDLASHPGERGRTVDRLGRLEAVRGDTPRPFAERGEEDKVHPARGHIFAAERARCHGSMGGLPDRWRMAADACAEAHLPWEEAMARYRLGQALLGQAGLRSEAAAELRAAARIAERLGAAPLRDEVGALASQAHISLDLPLEIADGSSDPVWSILTVREREVLSHLVAGRTYAEIAGALFISEKTVSVHVSNLLRKTGTSNRIEVTELARRSSSQTN